MKVALRDHLLVDVLDKVTVLTMVGSKVDQKDGWMVATLVELSVERWAGMWAGWKALMWAGWEAATMVVAREPTTVDEKVGMTV